MEDAKQKVGSDQKQGNQNRLYTNFMYKAAIVMVFAVIIPLFPSEAPEFMNQTLFTRSWELLHLLFVGIAVSYGLFSRRNDDGDGGSEKESKFDNAQSYVSGLLHVPSVFDHEPEPEPEPESESGKVQTWSSQYLRNDPPTVVVPPARPDQSPREKPLLLPVRSLKSRVPDPEFIGSGSDHSSGSKRASGGSRIREPDLGEKLNLDKIQSQNLVLPSPIPWRSRSGRLETSPNPSPRPRPNRASPMEESEPIVDQSRPAKPQIPRSPRPSSAASSPTATSAEFPRKNSFRWSPPPPPPPPPPPTLPHKSSRLFNSNLAAKAQTHVDEERDLSRSYSNSSRIRTDPNAQGKSVRTNRAGENGAVEEDSNFGGKKKSVQFDDDSSYGKRQYVDKVVVESEEEEESEEEDGSGPDVDKKADEFIAKFREQIRLQRIESIKKSSGQMNRKFQR